MTRSSRRWTTRHTVSLLALAAFTAALIAVRAAWLPPIHYSGRNFGWNVSLASNRDHVFVLASTAAQGAPRVNCFPRSLAYWQLMDCLDLASGLIAARDRRQSFAQSVASDDPRLPPALADVEAADSQIRRMVDDVCSMTSYIPSNPMRAGLAFGEFQTATHASHVAFISWYWIWAILYAAPALILSLATMRRLKNRPKPGHCQGCGYDLTSNESGKCPECGIPTPQSEPAAQVPARDPQPK